MRIASEIQMGMVPKVFPPFPERTDIDLYATLKPAKEVGGDLYDFFMRDNKLYFIIGDVSGKGVPASLIMAVTCRLFRLETIHFDAPAAIVSSLNNSFLFSSGVLYPKTAIGILLLLSKYFFPCSLKSSKELNFKVL